MSILGLLLLGGVRDAWAQDEAPLAPLALIAGPMRYSLGARRTGGLVALRLASPLAPLGTRHWLLEPSVSYEWFRADSGERRSVLVAELQLQAQTGAGRVRPYVGAGGGVGVSRFESATTVYATFSAAVGIRAAIARSWGVVGELRVRRMTLFRGWTRELAAGLFAPL